MKFKSLKRAHWDCWTSAIVFHHNNPWEQEHQHSGEGAGDTVCMQEVSTEQRRSRRNKSKNFPKLEVTGGNHPPGSDFKQLMCSSTTLIVSESIKILSGGEKKRNIARRNKEKVRETPWGAAETKAWHQTASEKEFSWRFRETRLPSAVSLWSSSDHTSWERQHRRHFCFSYKWDGWNHFIHIRVNVPSSGWTLQTKYVHILKQNN